MKSYSSKVLEFLVKTLNGMALGLFATLIVGVIIDQFGTLLGLRFLNHLATTINHQL